MKLLKYSLFLALFSCTSVQLSAYAYEMDKVIEKTYPIKANGTFEVSNRYGSIDITEWDRNEVSIKVTISVKTTNEKKAAEIFDRIDINFRNSSSYVSAETEIEAKRYWFGWNTSGRIKYQINYEVKMPQSVHLKCANKYGDTFITDLNNGTEFEIKYGNLKLGSVEGESSIDASYSNIEFGDLGDLTLESKYSNIKGSSTQNLDMDSKYSVMNFGDIKSLTCDTKYDAISIDQVGEVDNDGTYDSWEIDEAGLFEADTKYSSIVIDELKDGIVVDQTYGAITIDKLYCSKAEVALDLKYTDVDIDTDDCQDMEIDYEGEYTSVDLMDSIADEMSKEGSKTWVNSEFGNRSLKMKITMKYGKLKLR